jgi:hypothetical protein
VKISRRQDRRRTKGDAGGKVTGTKPGAAMGESVAKQRAAMELELQAARKQSELLPLEPPDSPRYGAGRTWM